MEEIFTRIKDNLVHKEHFEKYCQVLSRRLDGQTLKHIGKKINCTPERVRQIEAKVLDMILRNY